MLGLKCVLDHRRIWRGRNRFVVLLGNSRCYLVLHRICFKVSYRGTSFKHTNNLRGREKCNVVELPHIYIFCQLTRNVMTTCSVQQWCIVSPGTDWGRALSSLDARDFKFLCLSFTFPFSSASLRFLALGPFSSSSTTAATYNRVSWLLLRGKRFTQ